MKLLIIETIPDRHKVFEGEALKQSLEIMKKGWDGRTTRHLKIELGKAFTKKSFFDFLKRDVDYLHISAHGGRQKIGRKTEHVLLIGKSKKVVTPAEIRKHRPKARNIFVSACCSGYYDLARSFFEFNKKKEGFYLAPVSEVPFDEAFLTALQFHRGAFLEKSPKKAGKYMEELKTVKKTYAFFEFP